MAGYLLAKMTGAEIREAAKAGRAILVPVGAIENHGDHLPVDTDNLAVTTICEEAARSRPDLLICAPPVHYGYNAHNMDFPGTIDISPTHLLDYCMDIGLSLAHTGFSTILYVNGHGSNGIVLELAARQVTVRTGVKCASVSYWSLITAEVDQLRQSPFPGGMGHACEFETSLYLYLDESRVAREKMAGNIIGHVTKHVWHDLFVSSPVRFVPRTSQISPSTMVSGDPTVASAEKGRVWIEAATSRLVEVALELMELDLPPPVNHQYKPGD